MGDEYLQEQKVTSPYEPALEVNPQPQCESFSLSS